MPIISDEMDKKVLQALIVHPADRVARMYNLRIAAVHQIKQEDDNKRLQLLNLQTEFEFQQQLKRVIADAPNNSYEFRPIDPTSLEYQLRTGFFTPDGKATPALWAFMAQHMKKTGHVLLDILQDHEIFTPEQLTNALDLDQQIDNLTKHQKLSIVRRILKEVQDDYTINPAQSSTNLPNR